MAVFVHSYERNLIYLTTPYNMFYLKKCIKTSTLKCNATLTETSFKASGTVRSMTYSRCTTLTMPIKKNALYFFESVYCAKIFKPVETSELNPATPKSVALKY